MVGPCRTLTPTTMGWPGGGGGRGFPKRPRSRKRVPGTLLRGCVGGGAMQGPDYRAKVRGRCGRRAGRGGGWDGGVPEASSRSESLERVREPHQAALVLSPHLCLSHTPAPPSPPPPHAPCPPAPQLRPSPSAPPTPPHLPPPPAPSPRPACTAQVEGALKGMKDDPEGFWVSGLFGFYRKPYTVHTLCLHGTPPAYLF